MTLYGVVPQYLEYDDNYYFFSNYLVKKMRVFFDPSEAMEYAYRMNKNFVEANHNSNWRHVSGDDLEDERTRFVKKHWEGDERMRVTYHDIGVAAENRGVPDGF